MTAEALDEITEVAVALGATSIGDHSWAFPVGVDLGPFILATLRFAVPTELWRFGAVMGVRLLLAGRDDQP